MVLAAHFTPLGGRLGLVAQTVETVRFTRPERVDFRLVRGPVPHVVEAFVLTSKPVGPARDWPTTGRSGPTSGRRDSAGASWLRAAGRRRSRPRWRRSRPKPNDGRRASWHADAPAPTDRPQPQADSRHHLDVAGPVLSASTARVAGVATWAARSGRWPGPGRPSGAGRVFSVTVGVHQQPALHRPTRQIERPGARLSQCRIRRVGGDPHDKVVATHAAGHLAMQQRRTRRSFHGMTRPGGAAARCVGLGRGHGAARPSPDGTQRWSAGRQAPGDTPAVPK
jgi:hypothetical protein